MGGLGSGNRYRYETKATVEESLGVAMRDFRGRIFQGAAGTLSWKWAGGNTSSIGYFVTWGKGPIITLNYRWRDSEDVRIPIPLQATPLHFGGERWWFTCPLIVNGGDDKRHGPIERGGAFGLLARDAGLKTVELKAVERQWRCSWACEGVAGSSGPKPISENDTNPDVGPCV